MKEIFKFENFKRLFSIVTLFLLGISAISFAVLYLEQSGVGFIKNNKFLIEILVVLVVCLLSVISYLFSERDDCFIIKLTLTFLVFSSVITLGLYLVKVCGIEDKIDSIDSLRLYILSYGGLIVPIFCLLQFLQVIFLPIPSVVLLGVGIAIFGWFWGALLSYFSIVLGSIVAFIIGRKFGVKTVGWLIGKKNLNKGLKMIKGKDKVFLTFALIFPFFPDDLLCFVSGLSTVSLKFFAVIVSLARLISISVSVLLLTGKLLPTFKTSGGLIWLIFFAITVIICIYIYKNGENIENRIKRVFKRKNGKNDSSRRFE